MIVDKEKNTIIFSVRKVRGNYENGENGDIFVFLNMVMWVGIPSMGWATQCAKFVLITNIALQ